MEKYSFIFVLMAFVVSQLESLLSLNYLLSLLFSFLCSTFVFFCTLKLLNKKLPKFMLDIIVLFTFCCLSFGLHSIHGHYLLMQQFDDQNTARECRAVGIVTGLPVVKVGRVSFYLKVLTIDCQGNKLDIDKVSLNFYQKNHQITLLAGDKLTANIKIKTPRPYYSANTFDTALWALNNNINAIGYVRNIINHEVNYSKVHGVRHRMQRWIDQLPEGSNVAKATINALILGDKSNFSDTQWQQMRNTGTVHLFVVSGLHIGIVVMVGWWLCFALRMVMTLINHRFSLLYFPEIGSLIVSFSYVLLAGAGLSTQRAWLMAFILIAGRWFNHQFTVWQRWWFALAVIVLLQPLSVAQSGLWLSFAAVASLIFLQHYRAQGNKWAIIWRSQIWVWLGLLPVLLLYFQQISLISPFVNIVAITFISLLLMLLPSVLLLSYLGWHFPLYCLTKTLDMFWAVIGEVSEYAELYTVTLDRLEVILFVLIFLSCSCVLLPISRKIKCVAVSVWLLVFYPPKVTEVPENQFEATIINVGQGLSVFIRTKQHNMLFDTGAGFTGGFNYFDSVVQPYLKSLAIKKLDLLTISHVDNDHSGGLLFVQKALSINQLDSELAGNGRIDNKKCISGKSWYWDGVFFHYRQPKTTLKTKPNNRSCVLELGNKYCQLIVMGDAEKPIENNLLVSQLSAKKKVLVVGHHGSNTSTTEAFLEREGFSYALISNGYLNRYGHPHTKVIERLRNKNIEILRTDLNGSLYVKSNRNGCQIVGHKQSKKRYWW